MEAADLPNSSYMWKSIMAAKPILQRGSCWRVGNGETIRILKDAWLPSSPTNKVLHPVQNIEEGMMVAELIDPVSWWWDREFILRSFNRKEAESHFASAS